ncbi:SDR family NAD(P)-dependent oxidoreductase [Actinacidiphila oryziradicis]|uniref:SDR family NAD(P)-dependent oxidoreductase n=1 Tax=Actinacidiphila oryziradicis TaxID=2571141 RepID=A0A4U0SI59_9ACTN|nr:SDR family NAD(P)-dependent oxidoreductase [Actinacidiphila oryziradicis]
MRFGAVRSLICCAGITKPSYFADLTANDQRRHMDVNYFGTLFAVREAIPDLMTTSHGSITCISSAAGFVGVFGYGAYVPNKFAVTARNSNRRAQEHPRSLAPPPPPGPAELGLVQVVAGARQLLAPAHHPDPAREVRTWRPVAPGRNQTSSRSRAFTGSPVSKDRFAASAVTRDRAPSVTPAARPRGSAPPGVRPPNRSSSMRTSPPPWPPSPVATFTSPGRSHNRRSSS